MQIFDLFHNIKTTFEKAENPIANSIWKMNTDKNKSPNTQ